MRSTAARRKALRAHRKLVKEAAFAPRGQKIERLNKVRAWVRDQLKRETKHDC